jgi:hypothetical protein
VFSILDAAEELDCHEIVMPAPSKGLSNIFFDGVVSAVRPGPRGVSLGVVHNEGGAA